VGAGAAALRALGLDSQSRVSSHRVEPLGGGTPYYLVLAGTQEAPVAAAVVDARSAEIGISAKLSGATWPWLLSEDAAIARAGLAPPVRTRLVWAPCTASLSPLYPLWEVSNGAERIFVDNSGRRWPVLTRAGPG